MSTQNFYFQNILVTVECDEWESYEYEDFKENLRSDLQLAIKNGSCVSEWEPDNRSHPGVIIFTVDINRNTIAYGEELYKRINVVVRSGYYSGINIDYVIEDGECVDSNYHLEKQLNAKIRKIEKVIRAHGTELKRLAVFSNGEAVYQRA